MIISEFFLFYKFPSNVSLQISNILIAKVNPILHWPYKLMRPTLQSAPNKLPLNAKLSSSSILSSATAFTASLKKAISTRKSSFLTDVPEVFLESEISDSIQAKIKSNFVTPSGLLTGNSESRCCYRNLLTLLPKDMNELMIVRRKYRAGLIECTEFSVGCINR